MVKKNISSLENRKFVCLESNSIRNSTKYGKSKCSWFINRTRSVFLLIIFVVLLASLIYASSWNTTSQADFDEGTYSLVFKAYKSGKEANNAMDVLIKEWQTLKLGDIAWPFSQGAFDEFVQRINSEKENGFVKIQAQDSGGKIKVLVEDSGQGIPEKDKPRIFERFYRADTSRTKGRQEGYGLGLAIAKKIVDLHSGTIDVKSRSDKGSTFSVHLPLAR